jgi:signal peptidase I
MTLRMKVLIGVALAALAVAHVAAAYKVEAASARPTSDPISLQRD